MMDERKDARTHARTDGRTWATLNALPHSTNSGGIKIVDWDVENQTTQNKITQETVVLFY